MFGKLVKNEFRNIGKLLLLINTIVLGMHLLSVVFEQVYNSGVLSRTIFEKIFGIFAGIYIISVFAVNVIVLVVFATRFYRKVYEVLATGKASLSDLFQVATRYNVTGLTYFLFILGAVCSVFSTFGLLFLCISIGQNWKAHPVLGSIISYWVITTALQIFGAIIMVYLANTGIVDNMLNNINNPGDIMNAVACWGIGIEVVGIAIMSVISIVIMKKKLNL